MTTNEDILKIFQSLDTRISTINDRTKRHTIYIRDLEKTIKELKQCISDMENGGKK